MLAICISNISTLSFNNLFSFCRYVLLDSNSVILALSLLLYFVNFLILRNLMRIIFLFLEHENHLFLYHNKYSIPFIFKKKTVIFITSNKYFFLGFIRIYVSDIKFILYTAYIIQTICSHFILYTAIA